ncbi:hypothetical protein C8E03_12215 [Lachnotalea glycerini]|nr:lysylphosphatidylglycerol synthase transmembrane domain-containing protein [Lachnotalea glycerini]PXV84757.1 hypothetical protein C8E03_12215 [Lachnotalea glycerini]
MSKRRGILNTIFLVSVFVITFYYIFHGQDMVELRRYIRNADVSYWLVAVLCVIFFIGSESVIIFYMMHTIKQKIHLGHCFLYSFVGFFFSCITPSATGGQPAQIYYMRKDKIPTPIATLVLMVVTITYKMVLVILGLLVVVIRPIEMIQYLQPVLGWCYLGLILNVFCVSYMLLLVFHPTMAKNTLKMIIMLLHKIHLVKRSNHYLEKIEHAMQQYQDVASYFRIHKWVVWNVLLITIVQRLLLFYVTYLTLQSFGFKGMGMTTIVVLQGMISVAVDMLPLPGGMGISEKLFLTIFTPICGSITLPAMVVSRGLGYYTQLILSALLTVVAHLMIGRERKRKK